jgi:hypothetical protein
LASFLQFRVAKSRLSKNEAALIPSTAEHHYNTVSLCDRCLPEELSCEHKVLHDVSSTGAFTGNAFSSGFGAHALPDARMGLG